MKHSVDGLQATYHLCMGSGKLREKVVDQELVRSLVTVADSGLAFIKRQAKDLPKDSTDWTFVFRDHYEALRALIAAYLLLDGMESDNHQCQNAYLCSKHPELDLDWVFLETVRLRRNAVNYRGLLLTYQDWKGFALGFDLHISALRASLKAA